MPVDLNLWRADQLLKTLLSVYLMAVVPHSCEMYLYPDTNYNLHILLLLTSMSELVWEKSLSRADIFVQTVEYGLYQLHHAGECQSKLVFPHTAHRACQMKR